MCCFIRLIKVEGKTVVFEKQNLLGNISGMR